MSEPQRQGVTLSNIAATIDENGAAEAAVFSFDKEAYIIEIELRYPIASAKPTHPLRKHIDDIAGIGERTYRIALDSIEIDLDEQRRLRSVEVRANPKRFESAGLSSIDGVPATLRLSAAFDALGIASLRERPRLIWDSETNALAINFSSEAATDQWRRIAASGAARIAADSSLVELRFWNMGAPQSTH